MLILVLQDCNYLLFIPEPLILFDQVVHDPKFWEFYRIEADSEQAVMDYMLTQTSTKFNYGGLVLGTVLKRGNLRPDAWFCSELCYSAIMMYTECPVPPRGPSGVTPSELRKMIIEAGCERVIL